MFLLTLPPLAPQETEQRGLPLRVPDAPEAVPGPLPTSCVSRGQVRSRRPSSGADAKEREEVGEVEGRTGHLLPLFGP